MLDNDIKGQLDALNAFCERVTAKAKRKLSAKKKINTGDLLQSIRSQIVYRDNGLHANFLMMPYGKFVDKGVRGANPSKIKGGVQKAPSSPYSFGGGSGGKLANAIKTWTKQKGLMPRLNQSVKSMNYAITKSIYFQGIKPTLFFTRAYQDERPKLIKDLENKTVSDATRLFLNNIIIKTYKK